MFNKLFSACLISVISLGLVSLCSAADPKPKSAASVEVHTIQLQGMELKGEEIDFKIQRDGKHIISLRGQSVIQIDEMTFSAGIIEATYTKKQEDVVLKLSDNVEIISKADQFRAKALSAEVDFEKKSLTLKSGEGKHVTLIQNNGSKTTEIEASQIQLSFQDSDTIFLKTHGSLKLNEKKVKLNTKPVKRRNPGDDVFGPNIDVFGDPTGFNVPYPATR